MKKTAILLLSTLILQSSNIFAKKNLVLGVGAQSAFVTHKGTKSAIDRYNITRPWLDKEMGYLRPFGGMSYSLGWDAGWATFELGYNQYNASTRATGTAPGTTMQSSRELRLRSTGIYLINTFDFNEVWNDDIDYGYGLLMGLTMGGGEYQTSVNDAPFETIRNSGFSNFGMLLGTFYELPLLNGDTDEGLCLRGSLFYHGGLGILQGPTNKPILEELDPVNASVQTENFINNHHHLGLQIKLLYRINR